MRKFAIKVLFFVLVFSCFLKKTKAELLQVHVVLSHGKPSKVSFPFDPYGLYPIYPHSGQDLSEIGILNSFKIGQSLRDRYDFFLGNVYFAELLKAYTSNNEKTELSLQSVLAGLFPPQPGEKFMQDFNWQPIPYKVLHHPDPYIATKNFYANRTRDSFWNIVSDRSPENEELYAYIEEHLFPNNSAKIDGLETINSEIVYRINEAMDFYNEHDLQKPYWLLKFYPEPLRSQAKQMHLELSDQRIKIGAGGLMKLIVDNASSKQNKTLEPSERKMFLFSGDLDNINFLLGVLKKTDYDLKYSSYIVFELHKIDETICFKVYFDDTTGLKPINNLFGSDECCSLNSFIGSIDWLFYK